jgi:hypothetical protein
MCSSGRKPLDALQCFTFNEDGATRKLEWHGRASSAVTHDGYSGLFAADLDRVPTALDEQLSSPS